MMKKLTFILIMLFTTAALAQDLPKIAVYVTGNVPDDEKSALGTRMLAALVNSGRYTGIERSDAFLAEVEKEHVKQRSGAIDDGQISALGKQFGVKFVCIAAITPAYGSYQVSARIVDIETAAVLYIASASSPLKTMGDLTDVSDRVVKIMFGELTEPERHKITMNLGVRGGLNAYKYVDGYNGQYNIGPGWALGAAMRMQVLEQLSLVPELSVYYRELFSSYGDNMKNRMFEVTASLHAMAQYIPIPDLPFYFTAGFQLDVSAINDYREWEGGELTVWEPIGYRSPIDVGLVLGVGYMISPDIGVDLRGAITLTPLFIPSGRDAFGALMQFGFGATYFFKFPLNGHGG